LPIKKEKLEAFKRKIPSSKLPGRIASGYETELKVSRIHTSRMLWK
jgi:hypothetical protein